MKMRRIFSAVLTVVMLLSMLPGVAFGITTNDIDTKGTTTGPYSDSELYLGKSAVLEDDGTYTIRLEAFATGNPVTTQLRSGLPMDIVLVLDQSGSMFSNNYLETLRESVAEFIDVIAANGRTVGVTHRVGIVGFASDENDGSSNNADNKDHNLAGGSNSYYVNTGVFLKDGSFKNYGDAKTTGNYVRFDGEPDPNGSYYILSGYSYRKLTADTSYSRVYNPSTSRQDLFAQVEGRYLPAVYIAADGYYPVTAPDANKTYYVDIDGVKTPITATTTQEETYQETVNIATNSNTTYWIDTNGDGTPETSVVYDRSVASGLFGSTTYYYSGSDGNEYTRSGSNNNYQFRRSNRNYTAYIKSTTTVAVWATADGTVIDPTAQTVYDLLSTGWHYIQNGAYYPYSGNLYEQSVVWTYNGNTYNPRTTQFYVQEVVGGLTSEDYRDALMPVTDGEAGTGRVTAALDIAVSKIASSGATRTSLGMTMAEKILDNRSSVGDEDKRQTVVIVFTDGNPGYSVYETQEANAALAVSARLKDEDGHNATVYTIGLYAGEPVGSPVSVFMHGLSSNFPDAAKMTDVATITYKEETIDFSKEELTTELKLFPNYVVRMRADSTSTETYNYLPLLGKVTESGRLVLQYYEGGSMKSYNNISSSNGTTDFTHSVYVRSCTDYDTNGKYYLHTADKEALYDIFPEIITDSTTTTLDQKWLTADTLIRDIMETGFVFTNGTTVTMSTLEGTSNDHMITWNDTEKVIDSVTVDDPSKEVITGEYGYLSVHNQGGYYFVEATGFDFNEYFFGTSKPEGDVVGDTHEAGAKLIITISRVEATDLVAWNQTELTNNPYSGVWSPVLEDDTRSQIGVFPQPNTMFTDTIAVLDYAKTTADLAGELRQSGIKHLDEDGMNYFTSAVTELNDLYGTASADDGELTYTPNTMKWDGYDSFYVFGNTNDAEVIRHSANKVHSNLWSRVTVIPANNVYYEDTFVETNGAVVGIEFSEGWFTDTIGSNVETPEDGEDTTADNAEGGVHGWEDSLADDTGYSDGTAAVGGNGATATFTFSGTGVDIYSRTNYESGLIMASIYAGEKAEGVALRNLLVDNFARSGDYYMIPTLSIHEIADRDEKGAPKYDENGNMLYKDLGYGTYTVKLSVFSTTDDADFDGEQETRSTYYLDGIRIYNPIDPENVDSVVKEAYGDDELDAVFAEVRDILLDANSFSADGDGSRGAVFIDQLTEKDEEGNVTEEGVGAASADIGVYEDLGPENEAYLAAGQMIAFKPGDGDKYYVGLKSPTGKNVTVAISGPDGMETFTIKHTSDLFYEIAPADDGIVTITNSSGELLAVTKIKATGVEAETESFELFRTVSREEVLTAANAAYAALALPETPDIEIENPAPERPLMNNQLGELIKGLVVRIFDDLWDWFH